MYQRKKSPILPLFLFILLFSLGMCEPKKPTESAEKSPNQTSPRFMRFINQQLKSILKSIEEERDDNTLLKTWNFVNEEFSAITENIERERIRNEKYENQEAVFKTEGSAFTFDSDSLFIELKPSQRRQINNYITAQESEVRKILYGMDSRTNSGKLKMKKIDDFYLNKDQSFAHRKDSSLFLKLKNGAFKELKNHNNDLRREGDGPWEFFYLGFLKEIGYYLIYSINQLEGESYCLYNQSTGKSQYLNGGILNPSPNGQYWVNTNYDLVITHSFPKLDLWAKGEDRLLHLFEWQDTKHMTSEYKETPWRTEWIDDQTLLIETLRFNFKGAIEGEARFFELKIIQRKK